MKALVAQQPGYRETTLKDMMEGTLCPSAFFDEPVPVRGVCFAAGQDSVKLARSLARGPLGLGTITLKLAIITPEKWLHMGRMFASRVSEVSALGIILPDLDLTSAELQEKIAHTIGNGNGVLWFPTATDHRRLIPKLKLSLLVYLGLGDDNHMKFLLQSGQQLLIDPGSLRRNPAPKG